MSALLVLRSAPSGALFQADNDGDTLIWNAAQRKWTTGTVAGGVTSVFGRTGVVVSATGDYDSDQVDNASGVSGSSVSDALDNLNTSIFGSGSEFDAGNSGTTKTIDFAANGPYQRVTMTGNCTFTLTPPASVRTVQLRIIQNGTGGFTATWPAGTRFPSAISSPPVLTGAANSEDIASLYWNGTVHELTLTLNFQAIP